MTDLIQPDRMAKVIAMREAGIDPFPARGVIATPIYDVVQGAGGPEFRGHLFDRVVTVAGRLGNPRDFGKIVFIQCRDKTGIIQLGLRQDQVDAAKWAQRSWLDHGDLVTAVGKLGRTEKGELTIWVRSFEIQAKALAQPPGKWHGLADVEERYRRRYVDLWASTGIAHVFQKRSRILSSIRKFLDARGFLEVETPILQPICGGASARPFVTHHNALGRDLYLRVAPELYLKRLVVGGLERVFEIARNFRNEGVSQRHNPEFTMLELYQSQASYLDMMRIAETMIECAAEEVNGTTLVTFRGVEYDLRAPYKRVSYIELFRQQNGFEFDNRPRVIRRFVELRHDALLQQDPAPELDYWKMMNDVFEATCEEHLSGPVFCTDYPVQICPLAKRSPRDARLAERFELFLGGMELGNAFSELNDPEDQERRFEEQVASKDPESPGQVDIDYVQALEYGMPPTGGLGIGIDRLVMVLTGQDSIRDVLLFPAMKPRVIEGDIHAVAGPATTNIPAQTDPTN